MSEQSISLLEQGAVRYWDELLPQLGADFNYDEALKSEALRVLEASEYVAQSLVRTPSIFSDLLNSGQLFCTLAEGALNAELADRLISVSDEFGLQQQLRRFRRQQMVRIIWRDLSQRASLQETLEDLSALADACIDQALEKLYIWLTGLFGTPIGKASAQPQHLVVLGMGKLGARELNLSSDIDLIFSFPEDGQTDGPRPQDNSQFFTRLCQKLVQALDNTTGDGFVFRTDTRLRPYGDSGPLVGSFDFMEEYYQSQARQWERYAMIKARVVAGDAEAGADLMEMLRPFVYRRYLDYGAIESIREMKVLISRELHKKGMDANVKLGPGGIREIEFIGQAFQLIRGGRDPALQIRPILPVLGLLQERNLLPDYVVRELSNAYCFLRLVENRVQAWRDAQTHLLPADEIGRLRLARSMGFSDWASFFTRLQHHRNRVQGHFDQVFAAPQAGADQEESPLAALWQNALDPEQGLILLRDMGFRQPEQGLQALETLRSSSAIRTQGDKGRERMTQLMPLLLHAVSCSVEPDETLLRLLGLIEAVARRTAYLALLVETPLALSQLVRLAGESLWIVNAIKEQPLLLDELLDPRRLYAPLNRTRLRQELERLLEGVGNDDLEQVMDRLRQFAQSNRLRVAAADVTGVIPLMVVSDYLTWIAEAVCERVLSQAWLDLYLKHGHPQHVLGDTGFIVVGYGKLGGIELGYGSDLDLVFLHGSQDLNATTDGVRVVPNEVFYARLGQRMIHMLTTRTSSGQLYEVDTRLRPNGNSGMLVSSFISFEAYQKGQAWTWEHQALLRARVVTGDPQLASEFDRVRRQVLCRERDAEGLRQEVVEMREKMRTSLDKSSATHFDLKQGRGGIADIEFMVQFLVLCWAYRYPDLLDWTDNIRLLEGLVRYRLLEGYQGEQLSGTYKVFRALYHRNAIQLQSGLIDAGRLEEERAMVEEIWAHVMLGNKQDFSEFSHS